MGPGRDMALTPWVRRLAGVCCLLLAACLLTAVVVRTVHTRRQHQRGQGCTVTAVDVERTPRGVTGSVRVETEQCGSWTLPDTPGGRNLGQDLRVGETYNFGAGPDRTITRISNI